MEFEKVCRALYKYEPVEEGELPLEEEAIVYIWDSSNPEWWTASLEMGQTAEEVATGLVPYNYVEEMDHIGKARALYSYEALNPDELSFVEDAEFLIFQKEGEDWMMVFYENKFGFVPQSYVEEIVEDAGGDVGGYTENEIEQEAPPSEVHAPSPTPASPIVLNPTAVKVPPKDDMLFWRVSEVDKKKKNKKKVRLGISSDTLFVGSEEDKATPVKQWPISDLAKYGIKNKHILIELTGSNPVSFDFSCSSIKQAEAVAFKIRSCSQAVYDDKSANKSSGGWFGKLKKKSATPNAPPAKRTTNTSVDPPRSDQDVLAEKNAMAPLPALPTESDGRNQRDFSRPGPNSASLPKKTPKPSVIEPTKSNHQPPTLPKPSLVPSQNEMEGDVAVVLYNFTGVEDDELSVQAEERINVIDQTSDSQWWRCRVHYDNGQFKEGLVPSDYVSLLPDENNRSRSGPSSSKEMSGPHPDRLREWTDATGSFKVEAEFLKYEDGKIHLHKANGVRIAVPLEKMCAIDVHFVSEAIGEDLTVNLAEVKKAKAEATRWKDFFVSAGITANDADKYAIIFTREKFDRSLIKEVDRSVLKGLGLTEGDALRVEKAAQSPAISKAPKAKRSVTFGDVTTESDEALALRLQREENLRLGKDPNSSELRDYQIEQDEMLARKLQEENDPTGSWRNFNPKTGQSNQKYGLGLGKGTGKGKQSGVNFDALFEASAKLEEENKRNVAKKDVTPLVSANKTNKSGFDDEIWGVPGSRPAPRQPSKSPSMDGLTKSPEKADPWQAFGDNSPSSKSTEKPVFGSGNQNRKDSKSRPAIEESWGAVQANFEKQSSLGSKATPPPSQSNHQPAPPVQPPANPNPAALLRPLIPVPQGPNSGVFIPTRRPPPPKPVSDVFADAKPVPLASGGVTTRTGSAPPVQNTTSNNIFNGSNSQVTSNSNIFSMNSTSGTSAGIFGSAGVQPTNPSHSSSGASNLFSSPSSNNNASSFQNTGFISNAPMSNPGTNSYLPTSGTSTNQGFQNNSHATSTNNLFSTNSQPSGITNRSNNQFDELSLEKLGLKPKPSSQKPSYDQFSSSQPPRPSSALGGGFGVDSLQNSSSLSYANNSGQPTSSLASNGLPGSDMNRTQSFDPTGSLANPNSNHQISSSSFSASHYSSTMDLKPSSARANLGASPQPSSYQTGYISGINESGGSNVPGGQSSGLMSSNNLQNSSAYSDSLSNDFQSKFPALDSNPSSLSSPSQNPNSNYNNSPSNGYPGINPSTMSNNGSFSANPGLSQTNFNSSTLSGLGSSTASHMSPLSNNGAIGQTRLDTFSTSTPHSNNGLNSFSSSNLTNNGISNPRSLGYGTSNPGIGGSPSLNYASNNVMGNPSIPDSNSSAFSGVNPLFNTAAPISNNTAPLGSLGSSNFTERPLGSTLQSNIPSLSGTGTSNFSPSPSLGQGYTTNSYNQSPSSNPGYGSSMGSQPPSTQLGYGTSSYGQSSSLSGYGSSSLSQTSSQLGYGTSSLGQTSLPQGLGASSLGQPPSQSGYGASSFNSTSQQGYGTPGFGQTSSQPSYGTSGYGQNSQSSYGTSSYGQPSQPSYGTSSFGQNSQSGYGTSNLNPTPSQPGYGTSGYGQASQPPYGTSNFGQAPPQPGFGTSNYKQPPSQSGYGTSSYANPTFQSGYGTSSYGQGTNQQQGYGYNQGR